MIKEIKLEMALEARFRNIDIEEALDKDEEEASNPNVKYLYH